MNNENSDLPSTDRTAGSTRNTLTSVNADELATLKHELMKAEVRLAKARATVVCTEIDIKVLNARLKVIAK